MGNNGSFNCKECGSANLGYQQWVESFSPVVIDSDGRVEYEQAVVDVNNELGVCGGFLCAACGEKLYLYGSQVETEAELITYLNLTPEERCALENADLDNLDERAGEGEIIFPENLDDVILGAICKDYRQCGYSEEQYDTDAEVRYRVDKYINKYGVPMALAHYLYGNGYHEEPETVKANLHYVNNAMLEQGYTHWVDITPEHIQREIDDLKDDQTTSSI